MPAAEPARDPEKPFTPSELKSIQLAISHLHEYMAGYICVERLRRSGLAGVDTPLGRFFESALTMLLVGMYPRDRDRGLLPVMRLVGCKPLSDEIVAALERPVGGSTFEAIYRKLRDKTMAHPDFTRKGMQPVVDDSIHLAEQKDMDAFCEASFVVKRNTATFYKWFQITFPELVEHADSVKPPPEEPPTSP